MKIMEGDDVLYSQKYEGLRVKFWYGYCPGDYHTAPCEDVAIHSIHFEDSDKVFTK